MSAQLEDDPAKQQDCNNRKIALVTGSATAIGANIAIDLASAGYMVIVTGRNNERLTNVVQKCNQVSNSTSLKPAAVAFIADLYDTKQVDRLIDFIRLKFNRLDVLVNNACWRGDIKNILTQGAIDDLSKVLHINVLMPMYLIQKGLLPLKVAGSLERSIVINISSIASQLVVPLHLYSISKSCLSELSKQVALLDSGIISVTISPGPVLTDERPHHKEMKKFTLVNRVASTQEISNLVLFALGNAHIFNGKELNIDGGYIAKQK